MFPHPGGVGEDRFELLALKWLPTLSWQQAQELSPFEVGERQWHRSVVSLVSSPAFICAIRRPKAFSNMQRLLPQDYPGDLSVLMSTTPEMTFRQACLFFTEMQVIPGEDEAKKTNQWMEKIQWVLSNKYINSFFFLLDHSSRIMVKFLPPPSIGMPPEMVNC